ncbi:hypothetical protein LMG26411_07919 [Cupriavidus numazuensis]|uniref:Uncharacterized protein n=1 Tax=Cupriavidus numazuensis TaxID=221992 RepID=A0ABM8TW66_9BURK|nr:hypothetical protein LMG26411_07919 [Cupriavidus numazuensis]
MARHPAAALIFALTSLPGIAADPWQAYMIGQGDYRWLGMRIYDAQLWRGQPPNSHDPGTCSTRRSPYASPMRETSVGNAW